MPTELLYVQYNHVRPHSYNNYKTPYEARQATIYFLAIQMVQVSSKGTPRNSVVRAYYEKRKAEGKTSQQALICISRRLISVIYGMLKNGTEYRMPVVENAGENR